MTSNPTVTFEADSWTEHICRKLRWSPDPERMRRNLRTCGFEV